VQLQRRVLVVDDNVDAADMLSALLAEFGCDVRAVYDGVSAVEAAASFRPEMVLLDLGMATVDGYEVCRRLRREPWGHDITIVAVSGWGQDDDRQRTTEAGFDGHLIKPVDPALLVEVVGALRSRVS
jgi:CheY-like chemotaxis protein